MQGIFQKENTDKALKYGIYRHLPTYEKIIRNLVSFYYKNTHLLTYFDYPKEVRHSIYSTNLIEGFNKQLKKKFKLKEQFPTETSMEKYLVSQFNQYNEKFMNRIHKGFGLVGRDQWFPN